MLEFTLGILAGSIPCVIWMAYSAGKENLEEIELKSPLGILEHGHGFLICLLLSALLPHPNFWLGAGIPYLIDESLLDHHPYNWGEGPWWRFVGAVVIAIALFGAWLLLYNQPK